MPFKKLEHPLGWSDRELKYMAEQNYRDGKVVGMINLYRNMGYKGTVVPKSFSDKVYGLLGYSKEKG